MAPPAATRQNRHLPPLGATRPRICFLTPPLGVSSFAAFEAGRGQAITAVDLFEFSEPQDSATQTLRIKADANINPMTSSAVTLSLSVRTAFDEAGEDFDIQIRPSPADGIRLRVRVYLEGALE